MKSGLNTKLLITAAIVAFLACLSRAQRSGANLFRD